MYITLQQGHLVNFFISFEIKPDYLLVLLTRIGYLHRFGIKIAKIVWWYVLPIKIWIWMKYPWNLLMCAEDIWFLCNLYLQFIPPVNFWKICIDLSPFSKYFSEPCLRRLRSPRSSNLKIQNDENSNWKLVKIRWNPKFGLSDLENDLFTSMN